jgi:hypothetical protein
MGEDTKYCNCGSNAKLKFVINGHCDALKYWVCEICKKEAKDDKDPFPVSVKVKKKSSNPFGNKFVLDYDKWEVLFFDEPFDPLQEKTKPPEDTLQFPFKKYHV